MAVSEIGWRCVVFLPLIAANVVNYIVLIKNVPNDTTHMSSVFLVLNIVSTVLNLLVVAVDALTRSWNGLCISCLSTFMLVVFDWFFIALAFLLAVQFTSNIAAIVIQVLLSLLNTVMLPIYFAHMIVLYRSELDCVQPFTALPRILIVQHSEPRVYNCSSCAICLEEVSNGPTVIVLDPCHHEYHPDCIMRWLQIRQTCPTCVQRILYVKLFVVEHQSGNTQLYMQDNPVDVQLPGQC